MAAFALAYFEQCLAHYPLPGATEITEVLLLFGLAYFDLAPLLQAWVATDTPSSLTHFIDLLLEESRILASGAIVVSNAFSTPYIDQQLTAWLADPLVQAAWKSQLEQAVLQGLLPPDQTERASWAYEVLIKGLPGAPAPS